MTSSEKFYTFVLVLATSITVVGLTESWKAFVVAILFMSFINAEVNVLVTAIRQRNP